MKRKVIFMIVLTSLLLGLVGCNREKVVGKDVLIDDINEFYDTYSTSTNPPEYQRYYFYLEDGKYWFYHEKREGNVWPLTEEHITVSGKLELTNEQWQQFFSYLKDGTVKEREESTTTGDSGPWYYLYWKNDKSKYQEFSFSTYQQQSSFEDFCIELKNLQLNNQNK